MTRPKPALVTQRGARRLPRLPLLLLCAAYLLPGLFGRDPWRDADAAAFGQMVAIADGRTPWLSPTLGDVPAGSALLPHWLGALCIRFGAGWIDAPLAARVPFVLLLALTLLLVWHTTYQLARTEAAQPVPFAFGGEARPVDYARAIADGALLALMATLGLLQLGHETTPELAQLCAVALALYGLAAAPFRATRARLAVVLSLPLLSGSGAPAMATMLGAGGVVICLGSRHPSARALAPWVLAGTLVAAALGSLLDLWHWRVVAWTRDDPIGIARQCVWFLWPSWPLAMWTLWQWRGHLSHRHLSVPLVAVAVGFGANLAMGGADRALMLSLPGWAVLAAFALPTLKRAGAAAIDWFSICFFSLCATTIWVVYLSLHTGVPAQPAINVERLAPGYTAPFSGLALALALAGTGAWVALVRWRIGRHREALWKSLVLSAGGVALCWLLLLTLWLSLLDYARSPRPFVERLAPHVGRENCIAAPDFPMSTVAALEYFGHWRVDARKEAQEGRCNILLLATRARPLPAAPAGWRQVAEVRAPTERKETTIVYRRETPR